MLRHRNFDIGTHEKVEVSANATCCVSEITLEAVGISTGQSQVVKLSSHPPKLGKLGIFLALDTFLSLAFSLDLTLVKLRI